MRRMHDEKQAKALTRDMMPATVQLATRLIVSGMRKGQVKAALIDRFGISAWACDRVITEACPVILGQLEASLAPRRANALEACRAAAMSETSTAEERTRAQHRLDSIRMYQAVLTDRSARPRERLIAQQHIDQLLGIDNGVRL